MVKQYQPTQWTMKLEQPPGDNGGQEAWHATTQVAKSQT